MKKTFLLLLILASFSFMSRSQTVLNPGTTSQPEKKKACLKISSLNISSQSNLYKSRERDNNNSDQNGNAPDLNDNSTNQNDNRNNPMMGNFNSNGNTRKMLNLEIGFNPYSKKLGTYNTKREMLIGLYYSGSDLVNHNTTKFSSTTGDTLSFNSVIYQTDTITRTHHIYRKEADVLGVSFQYLYKTDPEKMFSLFTGYGINAGYTITSRIYEKTTRDSAVTLNFLNAKPNYNNFNDLSLLGTDEITTQMNGKPTILASVFIPFGVNMRLCKTKEVWNQMNLFIKGNVGLETDITIDRGTHFLPYASVSAGFKFNLK
ncbi:MAG: hypothetical protein WCH34_16560 [Bacteroidota bacterium]